MNLFLSTLSVHNTPFGIFFSDDLSEISEVKCKRNDFFLDRLEKFPALKKVRKIFYVSGPASFTSLRNMSVFLNILSEFSSENKKVNLYEIPTADFFSITFPYSDAHILSIGRRESFVFHSGEYIKYKNNDAIHFLKKLSKEKSEISSLSTEDLIISGEISEKFLEIQNKEIPNITFEFPINQKEFLQSILKNSQTFLQKNNRATVDYGALPNIG